MNVVMHLCVCLYLCTCMRNNLYLYETPIYFRNIDYLLIIFYRVFSDVDMHMSFNFGEKF